MLCLTIWNIFPRSIIAGQCAVDHMKTVLCKHNFRQNIIRQELMWLHDIHPGQLHNCSYWYIVSPHIPHPSAFFALGTKQQTERNQNKLDWGSIRSSLRDDLSTPYKSTKEEWIPSFGPSCTEFVFPGCWHFDNGATIKIDDVLT